MACHQCGKEGHFAKDCDATPEYKSDDENEDKLTNDQKMERELCKGAVYYADVENVAVKPKRQ